MRLNRQLACSAMLLSIWSIFLMNAAVRGSSLSSLLSSRATTVRATPADRLAPCTLINPSTREIISLNRLSQSTGRDYSAVDEQSGDVFLINVCRAVMTEVWGVQDPGSVGIYRQREGQKGESLGSWNSTLRPHGNSASIVYGDGSPCQSNPHLKMGSIISFQCAQDVWDAGKPEFAGSLNGCQFFFTWRTSFACGSLVQRSLWHSLQVIAMAAFVIFVVYYVLFFSYRRFHLNLRGREQLPPTPSLSHFSPLASAVGMKLEDLLSSVFGSVGPLRAGMTRQSGGWSPTTARAWWEHHHQPSHQHSRLGHSQSSCKPTRLNSTRVQDEDPTVEATPFKEFSATSRLQARIELEETDGRPLKREGLSRRSSASSDLSSIGVPRIICTDVHNQTGRVV